MRKALSISLMGHFLLARTEHGCSWHGLLEISAPPTIVWRRDFPHRRSTGDVYAFLKDAVAPWDREGFVTLILDKKHHLIGVEEVGVGSLTASIVHPHLCAAARK